MRQRLPKADIEELLLGYLTGQRAVTASRDVERYLVGEPFTGRKFEQLADFDHPNVVTAKDLVAVTMLGVNVPAGCAIWILGEGAPLLSELLRVIPSDIDIWEASDDHFADANKLWRLLDEANWPTAGKPNWMGPAKISKLLAAKRPRLLPINDSVVRAALGNPGSFWGNLRGAMRRRSSPVVEAAHELRRGDLSVLRTVDVVVWMANHHPLSDDPPLPGR